FFYFDYIMENQLAKSIEERTFQYQDSLPSLPVPSLEESLKKYLESVKPFANEEEYKKTEEIVQKFQNGVGEKLHQKLLERAKGKRNWLEEWWLNVAYLDVRIPSQLYVNFVGPSPHFEHYWPPREGTQLERGSIILWHNLNYWQLLRREKLPVHKSGNTPLDMNQFRMLFSTCKIPGIARDSIMNYFRTVRLCSSSSSPWAREYLIGLDPENLTLLEKIQTSLFVYSMEDISPHVTPEDSSQHAPYDAMVMVNIAHYVDERILETEGRWKGSEKIRDIPLPEELVFTVDEKILSDIYQAKAQHLKGASDLQIAAYTFTSFGKKLTKKEALHPDTFIQLALQLAYYRLHGRPGCCYETAMTRYFYHGRTETARSCTVEAVKWCQTMQDPSTSLLERQQKMLQAFAKHNKMMKDCSNGKGFDRHLLGLLLVAKEEGLPVPELFEDPLFSRSGGGGNFVLSTSLVGYLRIQGVVVPMVHHGYGFFYHIRDDRFVVACSAWRSCPETDSEKLVQMTFLAFHDMIQLMNTAHL
ncbi:hypothetical protein A6R68_03179, partial [Neotoma lepida]